MSSKRKTENGKMKDVDIVGATAPTSDSEMGKAVGVDGNRPEQTAPEQKNESAPDTPKKEKGVFKKGMGKLLKYLGKYWPMLLVAIGFSVASAVFVILVPEWTRRLTNVISEAWFIQQALYSAGMDVAIDIDLAQVATYGILVAVFLVAFTLLDYIQSLIMIRLNNRVMMDLRGKISKKINTVPLNYYDKNTVGDVLSRMTNDTDRIGETLTWSFTPLIFNAIAIVGVIIAMFITSWQLALAALVSLPVMLILVGGLVMMGQKFFKRQADYLGELNGIIEENFAGQSVVKAFNGQKKSQNQFGKINHKHFEASFGVQFFQGVIFPVIMFVGMFGLIAVAVVGGVLVVNGTLDVYTEGFGYVADVGVIFAFMMYVRLFQSSIGSTGENIAGLQTAAAASVRVFEFLEEPEQTDESHKVQLLTEESFKGKVEFENVKFGYVEDKTIIHNFSAAVEPGQKVAIVGPTGAGKTTMVNLLMRFYELNGGKIMIDGNDIAEMKRGEVRELFGMVLQDTWLFEGTIKENIIYNLKDITDEQVIEVCKAAGVDHFIRQFPDAYNTVLDDEVNISGGQRQLLTIARAMLQNSPMLILDEATSNVDTRTEKLIQEAMDKLTKGRTSFVIAHRLSTIKNADLILAMKDGDIVEKGTHDELLTKGGFYAELYNAQFSE